MTILDKIVAHKREEVSRRKKTKPIGELIAECKSRDDLRSLRSQLVQDRFHFICEIKKASPSKGIIQPNFDPVRQAKSYSDGGASAISILTDEKFFQGRLDYLLRVRNEVNQPILRKDFIIDDYQIHESGAAGADVILLITSILSRSEISDYIQTATEIGLEVLLEIDSPAGVDRIFHPDRVVIGINNRNLKTFEVNLDNAIRIRPLLPPEALVIAESGIESGDDCVYLKKSGFKGALIGETLMKADDPAVLLAEFNRGVNVENAT